MLYNCSRFELFVAPYRHNPKEMYLLIYEKYIILNVSVYTLILSPFKFVAGNHANVQLKDAYFYALEKKNEKNSELEITSTAHLPVPEGGYNGSFPSASAKISIV